jgi:uncharacterized protein YcbX
MAVSIGVGSVSALWRFPVKSMGGERLDRVDISSAGLLGDRAFALIDTATGKVVSAKSVQLFAGILDCQAAFVEPPQAGRGLPPVRITLPGGSSVMSDAADVHRRLSAHFGREVTLARSAPADFTIDQYHPDVEGADPAGYRDTSVEQKLGSALFAQLGAPSPVAEGAFFDASPVSVLTTSTLARLAELAPQSRWDERRFRMNVIIGTAEPGFLENDWIGKVVALGDMVRLRVTMPDPRCVMTTLAQGDVPNDTGILQAAVQHNRLPVMGGAPAPCVGVYAVTEAGGTLRVGDSVALAP